MELSGVFALANANTAVIVHTFYDRPGLLAAAHASAALGGPGALLEWRYFDLEKVLKVHQGRHIRAGGDRDASRPA